VLDFVPAAAADVLGSAGPSSAVSAAVETMAFVLAMEEFR